MRRAIRELLFATPVMVLLLVTMSLPLLYQPPFYALTIFMGAVCGAVYLRPKEPLSTYYMRWAAIAMTAGCFVGWFLYS